MCGHQADPFAAQQYQFLISLLICLFNDAVSIDVAIMNVELLMEIKVAKETLFLESASQCHFVHHKSHIISHGTEPKPL
jgi:hypothetical protein